MAISLYGASGSFIAQDWDKDWHWPYNNQFLYVSNTVAGEHNANIFYVDTSTCSVS